MAPQDYQTPSTFNIAFVLQRSTSDSSVRIENDVCFHEVQKTDEDRLIMLSDKTITEQYVSRITYHVSRIEDHTHTTTFTSIEGFDLT